MKLAGRLAGLWRIWLNLEGLNDPYNQYQMPFSPAVRDFVNSYQLLIDEIQPKLPGEPAFQIRLESDQPLKAATEVAYLISNSNISKAPNLIRHIYFTDKIQQARRSLLFAGNSTYGFHYALTIKGGEINLLDQEFDLIYLVAKDETSFFNVCTLWAQCELLVLRDPSTQAATYQHFLPLCVEAAGGPAYREYHELILAWR